MPHAKHYLRGSPYVAEPRPNKSDDDACLMQNKKVIPPAFLPYLHFCMRIHMALLAFLSFLLAAFGVQERKQNAKKLYFFVARVCRTQPP